MANENKVIKSLSAQSFNGQFEVIGEVYKVSGNFNTDGQKKLTNISGQVQKDEIMVGSFNAWGSDKMRYNFNDIQDIEILPELSAAISSAVAAVDAELSA